MSAIEDKEITTCDLAQKKTLNNSDLIQVIVSISSKTPLTNTSASDTSPTSCFTVSKDAENFPGFSAGPPAL